VPHIQPHPPPLPSLAKTPSVIFRFHNQRRNCMRLTIQINRHKRNVSAAGMFSLSSKNILRKNLHAHFHRSTKHPVHAGFQYDELAHANGKSKIEIIHRRRNHMAVRMSMCGNRARNVDQMHHASAQHIPQRIRIIRQHRFHHLRLRRANGLPRKFRCRRHLFRLGPVRFVQLSHQQIFSRF